MENQEIKKVIQDFMDKSPKYNGKPCRKGCNCLEMAEYKAQGGVKEYPCLHNSKHIEDLKPLRGMENQKTPEGKTLEQMEKRISDLEARLKEACVLIEEMVKETETHYPVLAESGYHILHEKRKSFLTKEKTK